MSFNIFHAIFSACQNSAVEIISTPHMSCCVWRVDEWRACGYQIRSRQNWKKAQTSTRRVEKLHTEKKAEKKWFLWFFIIVLSSFFLREQCHHHIAIIISIILGWFSLISLSLVYLCHTEKKEIWSTLDRSFFAIKFFNWAAKARIFFASFMLRFCWLGVLCESAL